MFRSKNVAMVIGENRWVSQSFMLKLTNEPTADFAYIRWANRSQTVPSAERSAGNGHVSTKWGEMLEGTSSLVKTVYGYFNINADGNGLRSAEELQRTFGQRWLEASVSGEAAASVDRDAF